MSYARLGNESDVYVYSDGDCLCCHWCRFSPQTPLRFEKVSEMLRHLMRHRKAGHKVPQHTLDMLREQAPPSDLVSDISDDADG